MKAVAFIECLHSIHLFIARETSGILERKDSPPVAWWDNTRDAAFDQKEAFVLICCRKLDSLRFAVFYNPEHHYQRLRHGGRGSFGFRG